MQIQNKYISIWKDSYLIHSYEVDMKGTATLQILCRYMQESAWKHAEHLDLGFSHLSQKNLFWVLTRQLVRIFSYPKWGETIEIFTWPTGNDRLFCFRDFKIFNEAKEVIGVATTTWAVLDDKNRKLQRTNSYLNLLPADLDKALEERPEKLKSLEEPNYNHQYRVGYGDLDVNGHVNNIKYIDWIIDTFSADFQKSNTLFELEVNYLAEALCGENIAVASEEIEHSTFYHSIIKKADSSELCRMRTKWKYLK